MFCVSPLAFLVSMGRAKFSSSVVEADIRDNVQYFSDRSSFRYIIAYNDPALDRVSRDIRVLMDASEFSETNLRALFKLLRTRFKDVPSFRVYVETSLQDIDTPEEREGPHLSEAPADPKGFQSPSALIRHTPDADSLYIYSPSRRDAKYPPDKIDLRK